VRQLGGVAVRLGRRQVNLVEHRDDPQVLLQRQIQVRQRLRLDALCGIHQQHGALTRFQRAGYLVGEVHVTGGVDQVQHMINAVDAPGQPDVLCLDGDAPLALDVHPVEVLRPVVARV
jgi:hypothetical protein